MRVASVDIGTNTVRLLVVDITDSDMVWVFTDRAVVRLGEGLSRNGFLKEEAIERTLRVLERFRESCERLGVREVYPIATAAVREASNGRRFIEAVKRRVGWEVKVISGEQEAYFTYLGVKYGLRLEGDFLVFDIGGGSTEYICSNRNGIKFKSLPMGVVKLTEDFIKTDPPTEIELEELTRSIRGYLDSLKFENCSRITVVGTAGTPTTLAAMDLKLKEYDPQRVHGHRIPVDRLEKIRDMLVAMPAAERLKLPGMEKGREDLIVAGIFIVLETLKRFSAREMVVSEWGIREGVIVDAVLKGKDSLLQGEGQKGAG